MNRRKDTARGGADLRLVLAVAATREHDRGAAEREECPVGAVGGAGDEMSAARVVTARRSLSLSLSLRMGGRLSHSVSLALTAPALCSAAGF